MANEDIVFKVVLESDVAEKSIGDLKQDFKDLNKQLETTKVGTEEYRKTLQSLGVVKGELQELKQQIVALNPEKQFAAIAQIGSTVAHGFAAAQGAMALFGTESEDLQKVLVRVQAATALASGLQGLAGFGKALQLAGLAMQAFALSNPFTAIAAAIVALVAVTYGLIQAFDDTKEKAEVLIKSNDKLKDSFKAIGDESELVVRKLKALGASEQEIFETRQKRRDDEIANQTQRIKILKDLFDSETGLTDEQFKELQQLEAERDSTRKVKAIEALEFHKEMQEKGLAEVEKRFEKEEDAEKKREENAEKARIEKLKREQSFYDEHVKQHQTFLDAVAKIEEDEAEKAKQKKDRQDEADAEAEIAKYKFRKELLQARLDAEREILLAEIQLAQGGIAIFASLSQKHKQISDVLFAVDKALAIATIVVSTIKEIGQIYASPLVVSSGGPASPLGASLALAAKIRAAAGIATIVATSVSKYMGGGGGGADSGSTPAAGGGGSGAPSIQAPQAQQQAVTGTQVQKNNEGDFVSFNNQPQPVFKTYVVESEITGSQNNIKKLINLSSF